MNRKLLSLVISLMLLVTILALGACSASTTTSPAASTAPVTTTAPVTASAAPITVNIGGTFALTGAYAEDSAACLQGFQDYAKWVNTNHVLAPWYTDLKIAHNI